MDKNDPSWWPWSLKVQHSSDLALSTDLASPGHTDLWPTLGWCYRYPLDSTVGDFPFTSAASHICPVEGLCSVLMKLIATQIQKILEGKLYFYWTKFWFQVLVSCIKWTIPILIWTIASVCPTYLARVHLVPVNCLTVEASAWACSHRSQLKWPQKVLLSPHRPLYAGSLLPLPVPSPGPWSLTEALVGPPEAASPDQSWLLGFCSWHCHHGCRWPWILMTKPAAPELASAYFQGAKIWYGYKVVTSLSHYCHLDYFSSVSLLSPCCKCRKKLRVGNIV